MTSEQRQLLEPHAKRKVRAFMVEPDRGNHRDTKVFDAFMALIYGDRTVTHATALAVDAELMSCTRTVRDVLEGWRPEALAKCTA